MAEQQAQQPTVAAPFPAPPPFYQYFTPDNLAQLRKIRKEAASSHEPTSGASQSEGLDILSVPLELRYLIPPPPPSPSSTYRTFNSHINPAAPDASLADAGIDQLYSLTPDLLENPQPQLLALARSLLTTFLALVGTLAANPTLYEERVNDIQTIMFNLHDVVNRYRPHQARESLILGMEERVESIRSEITRVREGKGKLKELIGAMGENGDVMEDIVATGKTNEAVGGIGAGYGSLRSLWSEMDNVLAEDSS